MNSGNFDHLQRNPHQGQALAALGALSDAFARLVAAQFLGRYKPADTVTPVEITAIDSTHEVPAKAAALMWAASLLVHNVQGLVSSGILRANPVEPDPRPDVNVHYLGCLELMPEKQPIDGFRLQILLESAHTSIDDEHEYPAEHSLVVRDGSLGQLRVTTEDAIYTDAEGSQREVLLHESTLEITNEVFTPNRARPVHTSVIAEDTHYDKYAADRTYMNDVTLEALNRVRSVSDYETLGFGSREKLASLAYETATKRYDTVNISLTSLMSPGE